MFIVPSIKKHPKIISCVLYFIQISEFSGSIKEIIDEESKQNPYKKFTNLVGRQINSIMLMYNCWVIVVVFHNILSFMTEL